MVVARNRTDWPLRAGLAAAIASVTLLLVLGLTAPSLSDSRIADARLSRSDGRSYGRVIGAEWASVVGVVGVSFGVAVAAVALALRPRGGGPAFAPDWPWVALALALGLLGPALLWPAQDASHGPYTPFENAMTGWFCVVVVWVVLGAGLRPRGSHGRGALLAIVLYVLLGFALDYGSAVRADALVHDEVAHPVTLLTSAGEGLFLPLGLADRFGLFGYADFSN